MSETNQLVLDRETYHSSVQAESEAVVCKLKEEVEHWRQKVSQEQAEFQEKLQEQENR